MPWAASRSQIATFTLSTGATATISGVPQVSGTTSVNFGNPVLYKVTAQNGTTSIDWTVSIDFSTGFENSVSTNGMKIYPNPSNGNFVVDLPSINGAAQLTIMNNVGQTIYSQSVNTEKVNISLNDVNSGIYFIRVRISDKLKT